MNIDQDCQVLLQEAAKLWHSVTNSINLRQRVYCKCFDTNIFHFNHFQSCTEVIWSYTIYFWHSLQVFWIILMSYIQCKYEHWVPFVALTPNAQRRKSWIITFSNRVGIYAVYIQNSRQIFSCKPMIVGNIRRCN